MKESKSPEALNTLFIMLGVIHCYKYSHLLLMTFHLSMCYDGIGAGKNCNHLSFLDNNDITEMNQTAKLTIDF